MFQPRGEGQQGRPLNDSNGLFRRFNDREMLFLRGFSGSPIILPLLILIIYITEYSRLQN